jgi:hypothetical protein
MWQESKPKALSCFDVDVERGCTHLDGGQSPSTSPEYGTAETAGKVAQPKYTHVHANHSGPGESNVKRTRTRAPPERAAMCIQCVLQCVTRGPPPTTPLGGWSRHAPTTAREVLCVRNMSCSSLSNTT